MHNFILKSPKTATFVFLLDTDGSEVLAFNAENGYRKPYFASTLIDLWSDDFKNTIVSFGNSYMYVENKTFKKNRLWQILIPK